MLYPPLKWSLTSVFECSAGLSKVAGCRQKLPPTWLVLAGYSAWHFFMEGIFSIKYPWTGHLLWQLSHLLQNVLKTLAQFNLYSVNCLVLYTEVRTLDFDCVSKKPSTEFCSITLFLMLLLVVMVHLYITMSSRQLHVISTSVTL